MAAKKYFEKLEDTNKVHGGFIKIPRAILLSPYFTEPNLLRAWIGLASYGKYKAQVVDGISLQENDVLLTKDELTHLFGVDKRAVRTILNRMQRDNHIRWINIGNRYTLVSIIDPMLLNGLEPAEKGSFKDTSAFRQQVNADREKLGLASVYGTRETGEYKPVSDNYKKNEAEPVAAVTKARTSPLQSGKKAYGRFNNVYLTQEEYESLKEEMSGYYPKYIEKLSLYLENAPQKEYNSHFAELLAWKMRDEEEGKGVFAQKKEEGASSPASYDIERAEFLAKTSVPVVKKREKR